MAKIIAILSLISGILPTLQGIIQAVESMFPDKGQGANKMQVVLSTVSGTLEAAGKSTSEITDAMPVISKVVSSLVGVYNALGAFKK